MTADQWNAVAAIAQVTSALAAIGAAVFISYQVRLMRKAQEVDAFLRLLEAAREPLFTSASNWVKYEMPCPLTYEKAKNDLTTWEKISKVVHFFESVGVLVEQRYLNEDLVFDQMGPWVSGSWAKLSDIIKDHRNKKNAPDYAENFELLSQRAVKWNDANPAKLEKRKRQTHEDVKKYYSQTDKNIAAVEGDSIQNARPK